MTQWDKKAKNYSRYNEDKKNFEHNIFKTLDFLGVDFANKTLLDVGCGTGVYTLHLAKKCLHVKAIDSSKEMLEILKNDAKELNLSNITTQLTDWKSFTCKDSYDIALTTMSPALKTEEDIARYTTIAKTKIYLGWAGVRDSKILTALFKAHDSVYTAPNGAKKIQDYLETNNIPFKTMPCEEKKVRTREFDVSVENFIWHLEIRGIKPNKKTIENVLKAFCDEDGTITDTTLNRMNLVVW